MVHSLRGPHDRPHQPPSLKVDQFLKTLEQLPTTHSSSTSPFPAKSETPGVTDLRTFREWLVHDWHTNPLAPHKIVQAVYLYHRLRNSHHGFHTSDNHSSSVSGGPSVHPDPLHPQQSRSGGLTMPWTVRAGIVWGIITTTIFASVAGWDNFLNYLLTGWAYVTFIPAALLMLIWWALPVRHFGSLLSILIHGRHHHRRGH